MTQSFLDCMLACRHSAWYPRHAAHCLRSYSIALTDDFLEFLRSDGMKLPEVPVGMRLSPLDPRYRRPRVISDDGEKGASSPADSDSDTEPPKVYCFPELEEFIQSQLDEHGDIFVKFEWTAPADATWTLASGTMKCSTPGDVYMILKASDVIQHDMEVYEKIRERARETGGEISPLQLVVRPWYHLHRSNEFRCFVRDKQLVAVGQRKVTEHYEHLAAEKNEFMEVIWDFFEDLHDFPLSNFTFDVYVDVKKRVKLLDVSPIGGVTDPLLFSWDELYGVEEPDCCGVYPLDKEVTPEIRVIDDAGMRFPEHGVHRFPTDAAEWAAETGQSFEALLEHLQTTGAFRDDDSSSSDTSPIASAESAL